MKKIVKYELVTANTMTEMEISINQMLETNLDTYYWEPLGGVALTSRDDPTFFQAMVMYEKT